MNSIVFVNFECNESTKVVAQKIWQYDYGQILRIQGLNLPAAVEIHFSLQKTGGIAERRIGVTKDGVTDVVIPDFILKGEGIERNYSAYAFVYLSDEESGQTEHRIELNITSRPEPEGSSKEEDTSFGAIIDAVNEIAKQSSQGVSDEKIAEAVNAYMEENPVKGTADAVQYISQNLTKEQQTQARTNIGAASAEEFSQLSDTVNDMKENGTGGAVTAETNNIKSKKWVCFGDSLTDMSYSYRTVIGAVKEPIVSDQGFFSGMTMTWARGARCALDWLTFGIYGAKWEWETGYKPDFVTVCFGVNDWFYDAPMGSFDDDRKTQTQENYTFYGCYCNFIRAIYNKWGFVPIFLLAPPSYSSGYSKNSLGYTALDYTNAVVEIGRYFNLPTFNLYDETHMMHGIARDDVASDGIHWNSNLVDMLSYRIFDFINSRMGTMSIVNYTVTNNLTNVSNSNTTGAVIQGSNYEAEVTANTGYALESVTVIYNGVDVTATAYNTATGKISITSVQGNISITAVATMLDEYVTVTNALTNVGSNNADTAVLKGGSYSAKFTVAAGCVLDAVTVTMGNEDITADAYNAETFEIYIANVTGSITITATATAVYYTVTNELTNATNSNDTETLSIGSAYSATIVPASGYDINSVVITMGGVDITADCYNTETGEINIANVTGNVIITVIASEHQAEPIYSLENRTFDGVDDFLDTGIAPLATDSDWTIAYKLGDIVTPEATQYVWNIDNNTSCSLNKNGNCNNFVGGKNFYGTTTGQVCVVATHKAGELTVSTRYRNATQTIQPKVLTLTDISTIISSNNLVIGAKDQTSACAAFACRAFKVWDCVITDSQAEDFLNNW